MTDALHRPLYEVVLMTSRTFGQSWINNLPFPSTLRRLTIEREASAYIDIGRILILCPLLESLHLLASWTLYVTGPWTTGNQESLPNRLALRSLVLERPLMPQAWMEALLRKTPDLDDLKLITITDIDSNPWDWPRFFKHLQALALPLKQFHYSRPWTVPTSDEQEEKIFSVCSSAQDRTFLAQNMTPIIIKCLTDQPVALTTLDILLPRYGYCSRNGWLMEDEDISTGYTAQAWHQPLCECSNLRHLKTLKIPYMIEYMDLHRRNGMIPRYEDSHCEPHVQPIPGIWICRGLETLYLDLHVHDQNRRGIAYGYISRVCPRLRDLRISFPEGCSFEIGRTFVWQQPFVLQEGLCLLSRLKWLERLRVEYKLVECEFAELNWLCRSGRTEEHRARRREIVEGWTSRLEEEAVMEITRLAKSEGNEVLGVGDGDGGLLVSMRNLGMLQDVKDMVVEMDTDEFVCLPELQQLACGNHLEQRPEKEIRSLFYSAPP
ncbi:hypothetical protein BGZ97_007933 [Linnemannia gamsii]|uniref:Uncharacterized protein n=1 Tax=Linnemannia gamsii TaxID=64522 RepID=A0A9P6RCI5_9FUNG|nr:hypothetical protein BGZ97_007933 [Linnemannia gamsii]